MMEEAFGGVLLDLNSTHSNFSKNALISTWHSPLAWGKLKWNFSMVHYSSKNRNRNRNSLNKHFTSKTYGDELVFDQIK